MSRGAPDVDEDERDLKVESSPRAAIVWQGEHSRVVHATELRPGQTIVVPSSYGGISHDNWAPASRTPVTDVAELAALRQGRRPDIAVARVCGADAL